MKLLLVLAFTLTAFQVSAQERFKRFYTKEGKESTEQGCYYYSVEKKEYHPIDSVMEFYCETNTVRRIKHVNEKGIRDGKDAFFYESGKIELQGNYDDFYESGTFTRWHQNGRKQLEEFYRKDEPTKILNYWDSLGNQRVRDGEGYCNCQLEIAYNATLIHVGKVVHGLKDSTWTGYRRNGMKYFDEIYSNGDLISGTSYDSAGSKYHYSDFGKTAEPDGGIAAFYQMVAKNVKYPAKAKRSGVSGKVFIEFVVEKDGTISGVKTIKGPREDINQEAERVVWLSPKWKPGIQRGQLVKQKMVLPISFKLG
jgi:TonB family protein